MKLLQKPLKDRRKIIFFDLEGSQISQELIAIGAIKATLDAKFNLKVYDKKGFKVYVKSQKPVGSIVSRLTHISDELLAKDGLTPKEAFSKFSKYIGRHPEEYCFVAYGNFDKVILNKTVSINNGLYKDFVEIINHNFFDFAAFLSQYVKNSTNQTPSLLDAVVALGGTPLSNAHDPLTDTKNLMLAFSLLDSNKEILTAKFKQSLINGNYPAPVIKILKKLNNNEDVTSAEFDSYITEFFK